MKKNVKKKKYHEESFFFSLSCSYVLLGFLFCFTFSVCVCVCCCPDGAEQICSRAFVGLRRAGCTPIGSKSLKDNKIVLLILNVDGMCVCVACEIYGFFYIKMFNLRAFMLCMEISLLVSQCFIFVAYAYN